MPCNSRAIQGEGRDRRMVDLMAINLSSNFVKDLGRSGRAGHPVSLSGVCIPEYVFMTPMHKNYTHKHMR